MAHAEDLTPQPAPRPQRSPLRPARDDTSQDTPAKSEPRRLRVNEITSRIGLTPITGLSGEKIFY